MSDKKIQNVSNDKKKKEFPLWAQFVMGALSGCGAAAICQPLDVIKNRMQMSGAGGAKREHKTAVHALVNVVRAEGAVALYDGISANMARQICYTGPRLAVFQNVKKRLENLGYEGFWGKMGAGSLAGFIASIISCPTDVALVRMTSDGRLPKEQRKNYKHVVDAIFRMARDEGTKTLWKGVVPTVARAVVGNMAQLVTFDVSKDYIRDNQIAKEYEVVQHLLASVVSGFVYAFTTTPLDVAKTRMQNMKTINGKPEYAGMVDVWVQTVKKEGPTALWKGFGPYYLRIAPNTVLLFIFNEQLQKLFRKRLFDE